MKFLVYCFCGVLGVSMDYLIYYIIISLGFWYQLANILGYASGTLVSFFLNRKMTFGVYDETLRRLAMFFGVAGVGFSVSALMLFLLVDFAHVAPLVAKFVTLPVVVVIQYSFNRRITFSKASQPRINTI